MTKFILFLFLFLFSVQTFFAQKSPSKIQQSPICNGIANHLPKPDISSLPIDVNVSGIVSVQILIDEQGNVEKSQAVSGHKLLRPLAENAAMQAKFKITKYAGKPRKVSCVLVYKIESKGSNENILGLPVDLPKPPFPSFSGKVGSRKPQVFVQIEIDENGNVISAKAISGHPVLRAGCEVAARNSKFSQTKISGVPVKAKAILLYEFNLDDDSKTITVKSIEAVKPN